MSSHLITMLVCIFLMLRLYLVICGFMSPHSWELCWPILVDEVTKKKTMQRPKDDFENAPPRDLPCAPDDLSIVVTIFEASQKMTSPPPERNHDSAGRNMSPSLYFEPAWGFLMKCWEFRVLHARPPNALKHPATSRPLQIATHRKKKTVHWFSGAQASPPVSSKKQDEYSCGKGTSKSPFPDCWLWRPSPRLATKQFLFQCPAAGMPQKR